MLLVLTCACDERENLDFSRACGDHGDYACDAHPALLSVGDGGVETYRRPLPYGSGHWQQSTLLPDCAVDICMVGFILQLLAHAQSACIHRHTGMHTCST